MSETRPAVDERELLNQLLSVLGARIGAPALQLSRHGTCCFDFRDRTKIVVELPEQSPLVHVYAPVMPVPAHGQKRLFRKLLRLNLFCYETHGATFAIHDERDEVILCYSHAVAELDQRLFEAIIENFLGVVDRWHGELSSEALTTTDEPDGSGPPMPPRHFIRA